MEPATDVLLTQIDDGVAVVTMHRPERRNALNGALRTALFASIAALDADPDVRVIVLTGSDPAFCAGLDLVELGSGGNPSTAGQAATVRRESTRPFGDHSTPIIGAVNGAAITGGFELALNCDLLVASERARFADTHARVGVMPGWGLTALLADAVGTRRATEISLTGNFVTAEQAQTWGLVNHVVPHDELLPTALRIATDIAGNDPAGVARMAQTYREQAAARLADAWMIEGAAATQYRAQFGTDPSRVESRRRQIIERGRTQI